MAWHTYDLDEDGNVKEQLPKEPMSKKKQLLYLVAFWYGYKWFRKISS